jgi:phosphoglycolate phosphatase-like HAD superfamily hydrolase
MDAKRMSRKILYEKIYTKIVRGRPKLRWFDDVREDLRTLKIKDWRCTAMPRDVWTLLMQEAKAHK